MNGWDIALLGVLAVVVLLAVRSVIRQRRKGGCCGDCRACRSGGGDDRCQRRGPET